MKSADRVSFIAHNGKQILFADFTGCAADEVKAVTDEVRQVVTAQSENSVLLMADFAGAHFSKEPSSASRK